MVVRLKRNQKWLPPKQITYEQFLDWADEDTLAEWVDGEVEFTSPASVPHQDLSVFVTRLFAQYVEDKGYGKVLPAPFQMKLANVQRGREPDVMFVSSEHVSRLQRNYLHGPADIAVEIISPERILRDRGRNMANTRRAVFGNTGYSMRRRSEPIFSFSAMMALMNARIPVPMAFIAARSWPIFGLM